MKITHFFSNASSLPGIGVIVLLSLSGCNAETQQTPHTEYGAMTISLSDVETVEKFPAAIRGRQDVDIYPQVSGKLTSVDVKEGEHVKKGQTLFIIDQIPYKAALQTAEANLNLAKAQAASARLAYLPSVSLAPQAGVSSYGGEKASATYSLGLSADWEIEIAGRMTNEKRGAYATLQQQRSYRQAVATQLVATIAKFQPPDARPAAGNLEAVNRRVGRGNTHPRGT